MRIVQFKRNRLFYILLSGVLVLLGLYILLDLSSDSHMSDIKEYVAQGLRKKQVNLLVIIYNCL